MSSGVFRIRIMISENKFEAQRYKAAPVFVIRSAFFLVSVSSLRKWSAHSHSFYSSPLPSSWALTLNPTPPTASPAHPKISWASLLVTRPRRPTPSSARTLLLKAKTPRISSARTHSYVPQILGRFFLHCLLTVASDHWRTRRGP
jgi:hypothetical protein